MGYPKESFGYYFDNPHEHKVIITKYVVFLEDEFILDGDSGRKVDLEEVLDSPPQNDIKIQEEPITEDKQTICMSARIPKQPERYVGHISAGSQEVLSHLDDDLKIYE